jgi:hypothetical protein
MTIGHSGFMDKVGNPMAARTGPIGFDAQQTQLHLQHLTEANNLGDFSFEKKLWQQTLNFPGPSSGTFVKNLFKLLKHGSLQYRMRKGQSWMPWALPLAVAISHGGRLLIQLPPVRRERDFRFLDWFTGQNHNNLYSRKAATHEIIRMQTPDPLPLANGGRKVLKEGKPTGTKIQTKGTLHYGINLALSGFNRPSLHNAKVNAVEDGRHGHAYLCYKAPHDGKVGGMLIGIEGSEAGKWDMLGHFHGWSASSSDVSMSGGVKFKKLSALNVPKEEDCMILDLIGMGTIDRIIHVVGAYATPSADEEIEGLVRNQWIRTRSVLPQAKTFTGKWTYAKFGSRNQILRDLDAAMKAYEAIPFANLVGRFFFLKNDMLPKINACINGNIRGKGVKKLKCAVIAEMWYLAYEGPENLLGMIPSDTGQ